MPNVIVRLKYYGKEHPRRAFYASGQTEDYLRYVDKGGKAGYADYLGYADNREKSCGVFGKDGTLSPAQKKELRKVLKTTDSVIWDMVVSFEEEYGKSHLKSADAARELLSTLLNRFFKKAGLNPKNMTWFAGLHENTDNRHIHVSFWENAPVFTRQQDREHKHFHGGKLRQVGIDDFKIAIENHYSLLATHVKEKRKNLLEKASKTISQTPHGTLSALFIQLYEQIPKTGRISYKSENMASVRKLADEITTYMLKTNPVLKSEYEIFRYELMRRDEQIREFCRKQKIPNEEDFLVADKTVNDLYRRLGNKVIERALELKRKFKKAERTASGRKRYHGKSVVQALCDTAYWNAVYEEESIRLFEEFREKLETAREQAELEESEMQSKATHFLETG